MFKINKVMLTALASCFYSIGYGCEDCGLTKMDGVKRVLAKRFNNNYSKALEHYSRKAHSDKGERCMIGHFYKNGLYDEVKKEIQISTLQKIADKMYPAQKAKYIEPIVIIVAAEEDIFDEVTKKLQDTGRHMNYCVMDDVLDSLAKKYKIKDKTGNDIYVRAYRAKTGYIALIDKDTTWKNFDLAKRYIVNKNLIWCAYIPHPHKKYELIPKDSYDEDMYSEMWNAFRAMCQKLGATTVNFSYFIINGEKIGFNADLVSRIHILGEISIAYQQSRKTQQEIKTQTLLNFNGSTPIDPRNDSSLKAWIEQEPDWAAFCNRRMNKQNPLQSEKIYYSYQRKYNFDLTAGISTNILWSGAAIKSIGIKIDHVEKIELMMEIIFPKN